MKILSKNKITVNNLKDFSGEQLLNAKRTLRKPLLKAFDIYKSNVAYGIIIEDEIQKTRILMWYNNLLNLEDIAFIDVPDKIKEYL